MSALLPRLEWSRLSAQHEARARTWVDPHLARRSRGENHPIWDFLFDYYPFRPTHMLRWHPGVGTMLADAASAPHTSWRDYSTTRRGDDIAVTVDVAAFLAHRGEDMVRIRTLLTAIEDNREQYDCFGLHEWAMVYRADRPRHDLPLRLGKEGTAEIVDKHALKCTHFDAYRFFTTPARSLNLTVLDADDRTRNEQCACLHVGMDLYKWAMKMGPLVPGCLLLDCFELARDIRLLDMEASPYDCRSLGYGVVPIETPAGKAAYVQRQRDFARRAHPLRHRLLTILDQVLDPVS